MKKITIKINNKMKGTYGSSDFTGKGKPTQQKPTGKIEINVKRHKGDRAELASTIKHELHHVKYPKATEKETYKATRKTNISPAEQDRLIAKLRMGKINQKAGAIKRKFKMGNGDTKPGDLISKMNEQKSNIKRNSNNLSKQQVAIRGLV